MVKRYGFCPLCGVEKELPYKHDNMNICINCYRRLVRDGVKKSKSPMDICPVCNDLSNDMSIKLLPRLSPLDKDVHICNKCYNYMLRNKGVIVKSCLSGDYIYTFRSRELVDGLFIGNDEWKSICKAFKDYVDSGLSSDACFSKLREFFDRSNINCSFKVFKGVFNVVYGDFLLGYL
jgi:hypothetical protein